MTNYGNIFADKITNWMIDEEGFRQSQFQMPIYYKFVPDGSKIVVLYYIDDCIYCYTSDYIGKLFMSKF